MNSNFVTNLRTRNNEIECQTIIQRHCSVKRTKLDKEAGFGPYITRQDISLVQRLSVLLDFAKFRHFGTSFWLI